MTNPGRNSIPHKDDEGLFFNGCWRGSLGSFVDCTLSRLFDKKKAIAFWKYYAQIMPGASTYVLVGGHIVAQGHSQEPPKG